jgi:hypothetical protein
MVCGVIDTGSASSSAVAGRNTQYLDCCKPSCGWSGKVSGSSAYVKSCSRDGYYVYGNPNVAGGCDGGNVFACNNQNLGLLMIN